MSIVYLSDAEAIVRYGGPDTLVDEGGTVLDASLGNHTAVDGGESDIYTVTTSSGSSDDPAYLSREASIVGSQRERPAEDGDSEVNMAGHPLLFQRQALGRLLVAQRHVAAAWQMQRVEELLAENLAIQAELDAATCWS